MSNLDYRETLDNIKPYIPGKAIELVRKELGIDDVVKMASNENPLGSSVKFSDLESAFEKVQYYPYVDYDTPLIKKLSAKYQVNPAQIILGNGSDEIFEFIVKTFLNPGEEVLASQYTYAEYPFVTYLMDGRYVEAPMKSYGHDLAVMLDYINEKTKIVFIANPNNPTGNIVTQSELTKFMSKVPKNVIVVLDEAYGEFVSDNEYPDTVGLLRKYPNLIKMRTFSKIYGLAGLRVGYALAQENTIALMMKVKQPFNVHSMALKAAELALDNVSHINKTLELNENGKVYIYSELDKLGLEYIRTEANFICIFLPCEGRQVHEFLLKKGVIIRNLESFGLKNAVRVTIDFPKNNERFILGLKEFFKV
jgi:histidinol-phosphate aminotransferase